MNDNKNKLHLFIIVVLIFGIIGLIRYIVYDNVMFNSKKNIDNNTTTSISSNYKNEYIKIINNFEKENQNKEIEYDLVYFNEDDIPDLVVNNKVHWVSLYIYENNQVFNVIEQWYYGAAGNNGYSFKEKHGIILNYNSDYAGALITKSILILNDNNDFDRLVVTERGVDEETENIKEINEALDSYGGYFYNDIEIDEQKYNDKLKELGINNDINTFKVLYGNKNVEQIKQSLQNN